MADADVAQLQSVKNAATVKAEKITDADLEKICSAMPTMTKLEISDSKALTNIAPIAGLSHLKGLKIGAKQVKDFSPLAKLTNLESIDVSSDAMGPDLTWLSGFTNLKTLRVYGGSNLTSFKGLPALASLSSIRLGGASPADLSPLLGMTGLKTVDLTGCTIADLTPLTKLPKMEDLNLYGARVKDFSPLAGCPALKKLTYYAVEDADFSTLGKLTQVVELKGGLTKLDNISWVAELPNLKKFDVFAEYVTDYSPLTKTTIESFQIWNMRAPVGDLASVGQMKSLKELKLWSADGATNSASLSGLGNLEKFTITTDYNKKSGEPFDFAAASGWSKVKEIDVTGAKLVHTDGLASAAALQKLTLSRIKGDEPISLKFAGKLGALKTLSLTECKVSDMDALASCGSLETVTLSKVEGVSSLAALKKLPSLKRLNISKGAFADTELEGFASGVKITQR
ncbi:hypothetical protein [Desulfovibrio sp. SGI.169]|uniref:leucine-rich repeat domain-containing protein n=1 Tax=Desulfovibrio sp. SGI.169 TaxID=3420561 RepID=UPI003CFFCCD9